jgi:aerobic-type carbon monoxide dehydrogenase small subunit (CoxS/CutS family)
MIHPDFHKAVAYLSSDNVRSLDEHPEPDDETIRHYLTGNLCCCAAYPEVLDAVRFASRKRNARASL